MLRSIGRLFARPAQSATFDSAIDVPGRLYAVGDVHGSARLLDRLITRIAAECAADGVNATVVMMGDYVDRGDDSRAVLDCVAALDEMAGIDPVLLRGNHETMLLDVIDGAEGASRWLMHGGLQTLLSYEVRVAAPIGQGLDPSAEEDMRAALAEAMGSHLDLLRALLPSHRTGNVFFAHAGADPEQPVTMQSDQALFWGTPSFLSTPRTDGVWVVHGHYVVDAPSVEQGRIAVDTGAYFSNRLTAARIENGRVSFIVESSDA
jgi:serine/threonine protein phosphatase 1